MMKGGHKEITLFRTVLWGYSTLMILFLTFFTLIPTGKSTTGVSDPIAEISSLSPIAIFLILIVIEHKKYKWNIWKVFLCVYSFLIVGLFIIAITLITDVESKMGVSRGSDSSFIGLLYIPVLVYFIILGYEKFS